MKILINVWYPPEKAKEVYNKFIEIERTFPMDPSMIKPSIPWETWGTKSGLKGAGIFEVEDEKFELAIDYFVRRLGKYAEAIKGYTFEIAGSITNEKGKELIGKELTELLIPDK